MQLLDNYIGATVRTSVLTVCGALTVVFAFFEFLDELEQVGRGKYTLITVIEYIVLSMPRLAYELFPAAALIGSLVSIGALVHSSELTVVRAAGVSLSRIVLSVMKAGFSVTCVVMVLGELLAPPTEQFAQNLRTLAINEQVAFKTRNGFWARDGNSFVNIRTLLPGDRVNDVFIYEFDDARKLIKTTYAGSASYSAGHWVLERIEQTTFKADSVTRQKIKKADWESLLDPELVNMVVIKPSSLSLWDLYRYISFLKTNGQSSATYEQALWSKLAYPLATAAMVFLAIPIVLGAPRSFAVFQRVLVGACIGLAFHIMNKAATSLGLVYNLSPFFSVLFPPVLMFILAMGLMRRVS